MKKAGRYVTAMIAAVMALNFASFTAAEDVFTEEVFTEEAAIELPMVETTVELPIEEEIEVQNDPADVTIDAEEENTEDNTEEAEEAEETEENEVEEISEEESEESIEEALDPDRYVEIQLSWGDEEAAVGSTAHFTAVLHGYENVEYTLQWQHSTDSENWENVENATDGTYSVVATKENCHDTWRVKVVITGTEA